MNIPPLNALKAFESSARLLSFSAAAKELHVTPGAISQQIKLLEKILNSELFIRLNRSIELTDAGRVLLPQLSQGFHHIALALEAFNALQQTQPLTITAAPSIAAKWLIPRLADFQRQHPNINVRIDSSNKLVDFDRELIDVGIRTSFGPEEGLHSTHLSSLQIIPVCSPEFVKQHRLKHPDQLSELPLLHFENFNNPTAWPDWQTWLLTLGFSDIDTAHGIFLTQPELLVSAAVEGQGVALIASLLAERELQQGLLVKAFDLALPIDFAYYLVHTAARGELPRVKAFKKWIIQQMKQSHQQQAT